MEGKYMVKRPVGRPRKYNEEQVNDLIEKFTEYINNTDIPIIVDFCSKNGILRDELYYYPEFSTLIKACVEKKEAALEMKALDGSINTTMAIFSLKQIGWSDKRIQEITGKDGEPLNPKQMTDAQLIAAIRAEREKNPSK